MKSERFLCATIGLVVAYFAVYLGDSVGVLIRSSDFPSGVSMLISIVSIVAVIVGIILMFFSIAEEAISESTFERVFYLIVGPFFIAYTYGVVSTPVTTIGFAPWTWMTPWSILLVLALLPALFTLRSIIFDRNP